MGIAGALGLEAVNLTIPSLVNKNAFFINTIQNMSNTVWSTNNNFGAIPVSVKSQSRSDLIILGIDASTPTSIIFSSIGGAFCGNEICETGETVISCPEDCSPTAPTSALLTSVQINPCYTQTWKINTTVKVTAKAETLDGSNINIYFSADYPNMQSLNLTNIMSGSFVDFSFIANYSGNGEIIVSANSVNAPEMNSLSFPFSVSEFNGVEYGDSSCGITQPLSLILPLANTTTDLEENFLTQGMQDFSAYTKLGMNILTFFILIFVTGGIFFTGIKAGYSQQMVSGIVLLVDAFIVLIAVNLGWINIGIVITLAIVGLIVIGLWISQKLHPQS